LEKLNFIFVVFLKSKLCVKVASCKGLEVLFDDGKLVGIIEVIRTIQ